MKKLVKVLITILVVVLSIGGTCFIFFKNYKRKEAESASLATCINKMNQLDLSVVNYDKDNNGGKFKEIEKTNANLEDCLFALSTYFISDEFIIQDDDVIAKIKSVDRTLDLAKDMVKEYKIKYEFKNSDDKSYFDKELGRNDLYNTMCSYIVEYATLVSMINSDLEFKNINKQADVKFQMIDLYCRVAINTFSEMETNEITGITKLKDTADINVMNNRFCMSKSYLTTTNFKMINSTASNQFINYYAACDRDVFAKNLSENIALDIQITDESTAEQMAIYYFKKIYGI